MLSIQPHLDTKEEKYKSPQSLKNLRKTISIVVFVIVSAQWVISYHVFQSPKHMMI